MKRAFAAYRTYNEAAQVVDELVVRGEVPEERINVLTHAPETVPVVTHSLEDAQMGKTAVNHTRRSQILDSIISSPDTVELSSHRNIIAAGKDAPRAASGKPVVSADEDALRECLAELNLADQEIRFFISEIERGGALLWFEIDAAHQQSIIDTLLRHHATRVALYTNSI